MSDNATAIRRAIDRLNAGDVDGYMSLYADHARVHGFPPGVVDKASLRRYYVDFFASFEHLRLVVEDEVDGGDKVSGRFTAIGRHRNGRDLRASGQAILHFEDGLIVERWQSFDELGLVKQLARDHGAALRAAIERFNARDLDAYLDLHADDVLLHGYPPGVVDKASLRGYYAALQADFEELRLIVDDVVQSGERVACRFTVAGRHRGGRAVELEGQTFVRFDAGGRIAERWQALPGGAGALMQRLGAAGPAPASA